MARVTLTVVISLCAFGACGGDDDDAAEPTESTATTDPDRPVSPSEALCEDLAAGMTPLESYELYFKDEYDEETFASRAYGFATLSCKDQLQTNEELRAFLESHDMDPDV